MNRKDIEAGFILVNEQGYSYRTVMVSGRLHLMTDEYTVAVESLSGMMKEDLSPIEGYSSIIEIKNQKGETLWKKSVVLTMQEIADKFGIPVEQLRIKK